jgi:endonuclease/exonuclease/phosphatase family metal-dependent hydrolase
MRIVTWNILSGMPIRAGADLYSSIESLNADILAVQEVDYLQPRSNNIKTVESIAAKCNYPNWAYAPTIYGTPGSKWIPSTEFQTSQNSITLETSYGIGLLSKSPVTSWHRISLAKSPIGLPLAITSDRGTRISYVADEPRAAIAAVLQNGITVITAHLSFVPPVNSRQLRRIKKWSQELPGKKIFIGDFNALLFGAAGIKSINNAKSYPSWSPKVKFDYLLSNDLTGTQLDLPFTGMSDHLPLGIEVNI